MNKKAENQKSTDRILKSKYLQKQKQRTIPLLLANQSSINKKIMLTDLCLEQKNKVGELIKIMQERRIQIQQLKQENQLTENRRKQLQAENMKLKQENNEINTINEQMQEQVRTLEEKNIENDILINSLKIQLIDLKKKEKIIKTTQNIGVVTDSIKIESYAVQTKRKKNKNRCIQVNFNNKQQVFYRPHTKSFEKIMKNNNKKQMSNSYQNSYQASNQTSNKKAQKHHSQNNSHNASSFYENNNEYQESHNKIINQKHKQSPKYSNSGYENQEQDEIQNSKQNKEEEEEEDEDELNKLAKKWLELKEKNISKIKKEYEESKKKIKKINNQKQEYYIKEFSGEEAEESNLYEESNKKQKIQNTFKSKQHNQISYDEDQLNKILKSKNFSAMNLLNKSKQQSRFPSNTQNYFNKEKSSNSITQFQRNRKEREKSSQKSSKGNINFYESELLDLVESLNP